MSTSAVPRSASLGTALPLPADSPLAQRTPWLSPERFEAVSGAAERLLDGLTSGLIALLGLRIAQGRYGAFAVPVTAKGLVMAAVGFGIAVVLLLETKGDYRPCLSLMVVRETERVLRATAAAVLLAIPPLAFLTHTVPVAPVLVVAVILPLALAAEKWLTLQAMQAVHCRYGVSQKVAIIGTGPLARRVYSALARSPKLGMETVAMVDVDGTDSGDPIYETSYQHRKPARIVTGPVTSQLLRNLKAELVIVAAPNLAAEDVGRIRQETELAGARVSVMPAAPPVPEAEADYLELDGLMLAYPTSQSERMLYVITKRAMDIVLSLAALLFLSPVLVAAAVAVVCTSPGPAIFRQRRVGHGGREFEMFKFRTMFTDADAYAVSPICRYDPRITPLGRYLRHTCMDEVPQLLNVLRGEMSLVGPRPEMPFLVEQYEPAHRRRLDVQQGLTGLWQLSADRRFPIHHNLAYDLYYIRHRNLCMDLAILLHSAVFAFRGI